MMTDNNLAIKDEGKPEALPKLSSSGGNALFAEPSPVTEEDSLRWLPTFTPSSSPAPQHRNRKESDVKVRLDTISEHFPPWRASLEAAVKHNERADSAHLYASLATIKPFGRPSNRSVYFRGFLSDGIQSEKSIEPKHIHQVADNTLSSENIERLANVLIFAVDVRSGSVEDLIHGSRFGEVCWIFPETREQFRLSGQLHLIVSPAHSLSISHQTPVPFASSIRFPHLHWEKARQDVWRKLSAVRRASYTWPTSHHNIQSTSGHGFHYHPPTSAKVIPDSKFVMKERGMATLMQQGNRGDALITSLEVSSSSGSETASGSPEIGAVPPENVAKASQSVEESPRRHHHHHSKHPHGQAATDHHQIAFNNFCLLLLDVDGADHVQMKSAPHERTKYRRSVCQLENDPEGENKEGCECGVHAVDLTHVQRQFSVDDIISGRCASAGDSLMNSLVNKTSKWSIHNVME